MKKIISIILTVGMLSVIIFVSSGCQNNTKQKAFNNDVDRTDEINVNKLIEDFEIDTTDETRQNKSKTPVTVPEVKYEENVANSVMEILENLEDQQNKVTSK